MPLDIKADFSTGDIELEDTSEKDAFVQSLLFRIVTPKGSVQAYPEIGSNILSLVKDSPYLENQMYDIISDAWEEYVANGEVESFEVQSADFDSNMRMRFIINVRARLGNLTISN